ncbi:PREDICTED: SH3 domain-containing protein 19 isoform X3 [Vollenhovia emeryi]|uniref:SH3 domain-containing protein 19 isoform X3 n=1 Tax=Vollenhovia emeryi TaxID=411798 RepID=UPI0005F53BB9|nr:PREDICTED: SH3 domain-containing protein 19 isoform X3 [Vollenhovia emeryi]
MAANARTDMRIPTRTAPRPPGQSATQRDPIWSSSNDIFGGALTTQQKKKPPPRPPPPKFSYNQTQYQKDQKLKKPARPTELLTNFFGRKKQEYPLPPRPTGQVQNPIAQPSNSIATVSLIDLSPPGSPTFTTRSSDGVSVDSFGSDGNSNPSVFTSSGNTSQTESAFEDDFDFFGMSARKTMQNDPWQTKATAQDPFGPLVDTCATTVPQVAGGTCLFPFGSNNRVASHVPSNPIASKLVVTSMPTIIRARPPKPPAPKIPFKKLEPIPKEMCTDFEVSSSSAMNKSLTLHFSNAWPNDSEGSDSPSPPMPTIPPPAPPANYLAEFSSSFEGDFNKPHGIALYDFTAAHPDDLALKEGDIVQLLKKINDDWMEGRIGNRQGIFPFSFIDIKIPLPGLSDNVVTALYAFPGENSDDLSFEEGAKITVISRISEDWLYGEYNGRKGQFPVNYVNRLPRNI